MLGCMRGVLRPRMLRPAAHGNMDAAAVLPCEERRCELISRHMPHTGKTWS